MVKTETDVWCETARKRPSPEIFIPTMGEGNKDAVEDKVSAPVAPTLKVLIWPLLDAIRKCPSGVAASEMPEQLSNVSPLAKGDPATAVRAPVAGLMRNTLIVELTGRTNQSDYQAFDNDTLAGAGATLVFLRNAGLRSDAELRTMTADDIRNTTIVELDQQTGMGRSLQALTSLELAQVVLGSDRAVRGVDLTAVSHWTRGVLLVGRFRGQRDLNRMSFDDMRNTLIVELTGRTNQTDYQSYDDHRLAGAGAVLVAMRHMGIRTDAQLRTMSADDMRNTLIVELDAQTQTGRALQGLDDLALAKVALGVEAAS